MPTKAATQALNELQEKFPDLKAGIHNCRKIAGTSRYSEHSSGNALDIYHKDYGYSTNKTHQAWLDTVDAFIRQYMVQLSIRNRIWRARNHYNHIHIDFWPRQYGAPKCAGGKDDYQYSSGKVVVGQQPPENGYHELPDWDGTTPVPTPPPAGGFTVEVHRDTLKKGMSGDLVGISMSLLAQKAFPPANSFDQNQMPDGKAGNGWDTAVRKFQKAKGLTVDGVVGKKSWTALESV